MDYHIATFKPVTALSAPGWESEIQMCLAIVTDPTIVLLYVQLCLCPHHVIARQCNESTRVISSVPTEQGDCRDVIGWRVSGNSFALCLSVSLKSNFKLFAFDPPAQCQFVIVFNSHTAGLLSSVVIQKPQARAVLTTKLHWTSLYTGRIRVHIPGIASYSRSYVTMSYMKWIASRLLSFVTLLFRLSKVAFY